MDSTTLHLPTSARAPEERPGAAPSPAPDATRLDWLRALITTSPGARDDLPVEAPFFGRPIGTIPLGTDADVTLALRRARVAQVAWADRPLAERRAVLLRFHDLVLAHQEPLLDLMQLEAGKARIHAFEEILDVAMNARYYAVRAERYLAPERRRGALPLVTKTRVYRQPVGVVGLIAPWNYPLTLAVSDALPALLAGNAVVLKPAEQTTHTALLALHLLREAGLPPDVMQIVAGRGEMLGPPLIAGADFIGFTGSTATGRIVAQQAGEHLVKVSMELGGKNALLLLDDADLDAAAEGAVRGAFTNAGQLCIAIERLFVPRSRFDAFLDVFVARTEALRIGPAFAYDVDMGSLLSAEQFRKVEDHVADAVGQGARLVTGGRALPEHGPYFYAPTILTDVTPAMTLYTEETFGPVVAVYPYDDLDDAIATINDTPYGLNGSVWGRDTARAEEVARRIRCGTVNVNDVYAAAWASTDAPMGGMKASGIGRRHGAEGILKYTEAQTVAVQRGPALAPPPGVPQRAFAQAATRVVRWIRFLPGLR